MAAKQIATILAQNDVGIERLMVGNMSQEGRLFGNYTGLPRENIPSSGRYERIIEQTATVPAQISVGIEGLMIGNMSQEG